MNHALTFVAACITCGLLDWGLRFWRRAEANARRDKAQQVLKARGMDSFTYLPSFGVDDPELREALAAFDYSGRVIVDRGGYMVGRLLPKVGKPEGLRLVVDNTK